MGSGKQIQQGRVYFRSYQIRLVWFRRRGGGWATDFRDSELNFSLRLQQLTTIKVNPEPIVLELRPAALFDYPFIYIIEPGGSCSSPKRLSPSGVICSTAGS